MNTVDDMREIPSLPRYFATKEGEIYSTCRKAPRKKIQRLNRNGYLYINGPRNPDNYNGNRKMAVHRLMAETFLSEPNAQVNHKDGNKLNNCVWNLEWVSAKDNQLHKYHVLGRHLGDKHWGTKIRGEETPKIQLLFRSGTSLKDIAKMYGVAIPTIRKRLQV